MWSKILCFLCVFNAICIAFVKITRKTKTENKWKHFMTHSFDDSPGSLGVTCTDWVILSTGMEASGRIPDKVLSQHRHLSINTKRNSVRVNASNTFQTGWRTTNICSMFPQTTLVENVLQSVLHSQDLVYNGSKEFVCDCTYKVTS